MSGGHWNYEDCRLGDLADQVQTDIDRAGKRSDYGLYPDDPHLIAALTVAHSLLLTAEKILHDCDWFLSGDTGPDSFRKSMETWQETFDRDAVESLEYMTP